MSAVLELIQNCEKSGVKISVNGQKLRIDAPTNLPDSVKDALRRHKSGIIQTLTKRQQKAPQERLNTLIEHDISLHTGTEAFQFYDVFSVENESGLRVINYLFAFSKRRQMDKGEGLFLTMPTIAAYESETSLVKGIDENSKGGIPDHALKILVERYIDTHLCKDAAGKWTGKNVPLFYLTLKLNGERLDAETCNQIQAWIVREFWLRDYPKSNIEVMRL